MRTQPIPVDDIPDVDQRVIRRLRPLIGNSLDNQTDPKRDELEAAIEQSDFTIADWTEDTDGEQWLDFAAGDKRIARVAGRNIGLTVIDERLHYQPDELLDDDLIAGTDTGGNF